jgi:hypothetical protein
MELEFIVMEMNSIRLAATWRNIAEFEDVICNILLVEQSEILCASSRILPVVELLASLPKLARYIVKLICLFLPSIPARKISIVCHEYVIPSNSASALQLAQIDSASG